MSRNVGEPKAKVLPQYIAAVTVCVGAWGFGSALAWITNITDKLEVGELNDIKMGPTEYGWIGGCATLGASIMCFISGVLADWLGRKPTCLLMSVPSIIGWLLIIFAGNAPMVFTGIFLAGAGGGTFIIIGPLYNTEISQIHIRGSLGTFMQLLRACGTIYSFLLGWMLPMVWYNVSNLLVPIIFIILFVFQPETPFYYLKKGNIEAAEKSFRKLRGPDYDFKDELIIMNNTIESQKNLEKFTDAVRAKPAIKAIIICLILQLLQKTSGINVILFFGKQIFIEAGTNVDPHLSVIIMGIFFVLGIVAGIMTIDRFGRTMLLMVSLLGSALGTLFLAMFFTLEKYLEKESIHTWGFLPVTGALIFMFFFNFGIGAIPFLLCSELLSPTLKAKLGSPIAGFNWFLSFVVAKIYYPISDEVGIDTTFYFFTVASVIGFLFVLFFVPETKNKTYEQILPDLEKTWKYEASSV